ncbi:MAG: pyridoxamine 5'-phosphate oxidase [Planctomycetota bacterium]
MPFDTDDLPQLLEHLWDHLDAATRSAKPPFHLPTLCTVRPADPPDSGSPSLVLPAARTVVLRGIDRERRQLICHTDVRSDKIADLGTLPHAAWLFYDSPARLQLRVTGPITIHRDDALAEEQWARSSLTSRRCYLAPNPPGQIAAYPSPNLPADLTDRPPTEAESQAGRKHFAVLSCVAERFEMLHLRHSGHRRAAFHWPSPDGSPTMHWLEP